MPEGLHSAGPTFCRMMKAALKDQVDRNVLSYDDDIVMASRNKTSYITKLAKTFTNMRDTRFKLNPEKCVFGVMRGKVLGCFVSMKVLKKIQIRSESSFRCNLRKPGKRSRI
jgi:hypothetical protein